MIKNLRFLLSLFLMLCTIGYSFGQNPEKIGDNVLVDIETQHPYSSGESGLVFRYEFEKEDAQFIKIHFTKFDLADGDYVEIYDLISGESVRYEKGGMPLPSGDGFTGEFWSQSVWSDHVILELHAEGGTSNYGLQIDEVLYAYPDKKLALEKSICGTDDKVPYICYEQSYPQMFEQGRAVCRLVGGGYCTAWLVGDQGHVMTNNHCLDSQGGANSAEFQFNYHNTNCNGSGNSSAVTYVGATLIQTNASYDFTLLQLRASDAADAVSRFGNTCIDPEPPSTGDRIYMIGHPGGRRKEIADEESSNNSGYGQITSPGNGSNGSRYSIDTEGGNSGSPVFDYNSHLVIALHNLGGCNANGGSNSGERVSDILGILNDQSLVPILTCEGGSEPNAAFGHEINCLTVQFTDQSGGRPTGWNWNFGDGQTSSQQNPSHTYNGYGTYTVTLTASNDNGTSDHQVEIVLEEGKAPTANDVTVCAGNTAVLSASGAGSYLWYDAANGGNQLGTGATYETPAINAETSYYVQNNDDCSTDDRTEVTVNIASGGSISTVNNGEGCEGDEIDLSVSGSGDFVWLDSDAPGANEVGTGTSYSTPALYETTSYFVTTTDGGIGQSFENVGNTNSNSGGGIYDGDRGLIFNASEDFVLKSAVINAQDAGERTIEVLNSNDQAIASISVNIPQGENRVTINLPIPAGNNHVIHITDGGYNLYRNNAGADYPYSSPSGTVQIINSTAQNDNPEDFYYFFYDWEIIVEAECAAELVEVTATIHANPEIGEISENGNVLSIDAGFDSYQWYLDGVVISGATGNTHAATEDGDYQVVVGTDKGCESTSNVVTVLVSSIDALSKASIEVFPNPASGNVTIKVPTAADYKILNGQGVTVLSGNVKNCQDLDISTLNSGIYILSIVIEEQTITSKITIE